MVDFVPINLKMVIWPISPWSTWLASFSGGRCAGTSGNRVAGSVVLFTGGWFATETDMVGHSSNFRIQCEEGLRDAVESKKWPGRSATIVFSEPLLSRSSAESIFLHLPLSMGQCCFGEGCKTYLDRTSGCLCLCHVSFSRFLHLSARFGLVRTVSSSTSRTASSFPASCSLATPASIVVMRSVAFCTCERKLVEREPQEFLSV